MGRSVLTMYMCECGEPVSDWSADRGSRPPWKKCPVCGKKAYCKGMNNGNNASTGEIRSTNLGCGIGQEAEGNRALAENDINARYDPESGDLVAANRQAFQEAQACRGMRSATDGGFSGAKMRRIRERSLAGNPRR